MEQPIVISVNIFFLIASPTAAAYHSSLGTSANVLVELAVVTFEVESTTCIVAPSTVTVELAARVAVIAPAVRIVATATDAEIFFNIYASLICLL
jgi:hypothetical protein